MNELQQLQQQFQTLKNELEDLRYILHKKIGGGSADIKGNVVSPSTVSTTIGAGAVVLASLASVISPTRVVKLSGSVTWSGSGATLASSVNGVLSTDLITATISTKPTQAAYLVRATPTTDTITFELSAANTSNDAVITYTVFRATS